MPLCLRYLNLSAGQSWRLNNGNPKTHPINPITHNRVYSSDHNRSVKQVNILSTNQTQALIGRLNIPKLNTSVKGEDHYRAKLSAKDVIEIRQLVEKRTELMNQARELTNQKLADKYGVSKTCIESVSCGRTWKSA